MSSFTITQTPKAKFAYLYPEDNGCSINCFPFGDTPNYKCVDDTFNSLTPDNTYVFMDGASTVSETYKVENHDTLTGTINYVKGCCRAKSDQYPPAYNFDYKVTLSKDNSCASIVSSRIMPLSTGFTTFENAWSENPFTLAEWEWEEIDALQVGFQASSPSVVVSPNVLIPLGAGDITEIDDVTEGYEHWEAVQADRPLTQVSTCSTEWQDDLYNYVLFDANNFTANCTSMFKFGDYVFTLDRMADIVYMYHWNDGRLEYLTQIGSITDCICMATDENNHYYVGTWNRLYILEYSDTDNTLNITQEIALPDVSEVPYKMIYKDSYLYVPTHINFRVYSVAINGELTSVINDGDNAASVDTDGTYIYTTSKSGGDFLKVYSFDGITLTEIDSIAITEGNSILSCDGIEGHIFVPDGDSGLRAFSFDGTNLALVDTLDNGGRYWLSACDGDYIHCFVDQGGIDKELYAYSYDGTNLSYLDTYTDVGDNAIANGVYAFSSTEGFIFIEGTAHNTGIILAFNGITYNKIYDTYNMMLPKYIDDNIVSITVVAKMGKEYDAPDEADIRGRAIIKTHGTEYSMTDYWLLEYPKKWYSYTWETNPNTSAAWTLAELNLLQAGIGLLGTGSKYAACSVCQVIVAASSSVSPEIHTSKVHLKVNYTPEDSECSLNKPEQISTNHARNIEMLNFWNGSREVYDLNRSGKSMTLTGGENGSTACDTIICIRNMARDGNIITISELSPTYFNGEYRIRSFGWNEISEKPSHFKWILEVESTDL